MRKKIAVFVMAFAVLASASLAAAQKGRVYRLGYLYYGSRAAGRSNSAIFMKELHKLGWVEGKNLVVEWRWADGRANRLPGLAADLVRLKVDVIQTVTTIATRAAADATRTIPIVFSMVQDPVGSGFVASFARPGGNITGLTQGHLDIAGKLLELLREAVPGVSRVAVLWTPTPATAQLFKETQVVAQALGIKLQSAEVRGLGEIEAAFSAMTREGAEGLLVLNGALRVHTRRVAELALKHRLPGIFLLSSFVPEGGLMSYAAPRPTIFRRAAHHVDRILRGAKPADLPVERPTKFDLIINLKTAKQIGLTIPPEVLMRATRVIR